MGSTCTCPCSNKPGQVVEGSDDTYSRASGDNLPFKTSSSVDHEVITTPLPACSRIGSREFREITASLKFKDSSGVDHEIGTTSKNVGFRLGSDGPGLPVMVKSISQEKPSGGASVEIGWELTHVNGSHVDTLKDMELDDAIYGKSSRPFLSLQSMLDVIDDFRIQLPILRCYFGVEHASTEAKVSALAQAAAEVMNKPDKADELVPVVGANLSYAEPLSSNAKLVLQRILVLIEKWQFNNTGRVDNPPMLTDPSSPNFDQADANLTVSQEEIHRIQALFWIQYPTKFHTPTTMLGLTGALLKNIPSETQPVAIITVGPAGSGKTFCLHSEAGCLNYLQKHHNGPERTSYIEIDPDDWIGKLCNNDNQYRPLCNYLNLATFFSAVHRKHNLIFGGTGKDMRNTCGRVAARLRQANYKIYYAIVLCSFETCLARIDKRFQETGRNVPTPVLRSLFQGLQKSVPYYVANLKDVGDGVLIYNNDKMTGNLDPIHLQVNDGATEALQVVNGLLALPPL